MRLSGYPISHGAARILWSPGAASPDGVRHREARAGGRAAVLPQQVRVAARVERARGGADAQRKDRPGVLVLPSVRILPAMPDVPVARVGRLLVQDVQPSLRVVVDAGKRGPDPVRRRGRPPLPAVRRRRVDRDRAPVVARHQRERARWGARDLGGGGHSHDRGVEDAGERRVGDEHRGRGCVREEVPVVPGRVRVLRLDDVGEEARRGRRRLERRRGRLHDSDLDFRCAWHAPRHLHLHRRHAGVRPAHADDAGHVGGCRGERERSPSPAPGLRRLALGVAGEVHDAISEPRPIAPKRRVCVLVRRRRGTRQKDLVPLGRQSHGGLDAPIHPDRAGALGRSLPRDEERPIDPDPTATNAAGATGIWTSASFVGVERMLLSTATARNVTRAPSGTCGSTNSPEVAPPPAQNACAHEPSPTRISTTMPSGVAPAGRSHCAEISGQPNGEDESATVSSDGGAGAGGPSTSNPLQPHTSIAAASATAGRIEGPRTVPPCRRSQNSRFPGGSRPGALRRIDSRGQEWAPSRRRGQVSEQLATSDEFVQPAFRNVRLMR